jgi:uncharacterized membrane protein
VNVTDSNTILPNRPILDVAMDPSDPLVGYAAAGGFNQNTPTTPGHVFRVTCTADCASFTWEDKSGNLPNIPADSIIANPLFPQQVFAGTDWGLYYTDDIDAAVPIWYRFEAGLPNVMIWDMAIDRDDTTLALFTRSRGAYVWPLPAAPIAPLYDATFTANSFQSGPPSGTAVHSFTLQNTGVNDDSYDLAVGGNVWGTTVLTPSPVSISAGMTATVEVQVDIPDSPINPTDVFTVTATSTNEPTVNASAIGTTLAMVNAGVATSGDQSGFGLMGEVITYTIGVTNTGAFTDTYTVSAGPHVWTTTLGDTSVGPLAPGEGTTTEVYVEVGSGDSDSVLVTFTSDLVSSVSADVLLESTRIQPAVTSSGDQSLGGEEGSVITYTLSVTNTGNFVDSYTVEIGPHVWTTTAQSGSLDDVAPGEVRTVEIYVVVGSEASDSVTITFTSELDPSVSTSDTLTSLMIVPEVSLYLPVVRKE